MKVHVCKDAKQVGQKTAEKVAKVLQEKLKNQSEVNILLSTGSSQFAFFDAFVLQQVEWHRVNMYHLDEYVGVPETNPASFCGYLRKRFVDRVPLKSAHLIPGCEDPHLTVKRLNSMFESLVIDVGVIGVGENAHIAFNDPPADFDIKQAYHIVELDDACKCQQWNEGWFPTIEEVPSLAISMTCRQIMKCNCIVSAVPDLAKAEAIHKVFTATQTDPKIPATLLLEHPNIFMYLDENSVSLTGLQILKPYL